MMNIAIKPVLLVGLLGLAACAQPAPRTAPPVVDPYASTGGGAVFQGNLAGGVLGAEATAQYFQTSVGNTVLFPADQTTLTPEARTVLAGQAAWLTRHAGYTAVVQGHAEETGTREYNLALGARRASAVQEYLVAQGVAPGRIRTLSFGKERPAATCSDEGCYSQNRRAVTVVTEAAPALAMAPVAMATAATGPAATGPVASGPVGGMTGTGM